MPSWQTRWGASLATSRPSNRISPALAGFKPEIISNSVVLPAPLGPPMPRISPSATSRLKSLTAASAPKYLDRFLHRRRGAPAAFIGGYALVPGRTLHLAGA